MTKKKEKIQCELNVLSKLGKNLACEKSLVRSAQSQNQKTTPMFVKHSHSHDLVDYLESLSTIECVKKGYVLVDVD